MEHRIVIWTFAACAALSIISACVVAVSGYTGWGWFLFVAILFGAGIADIAE